MKPSKQQITRAFLPWKKTLYKRSRNNVFRKGVLLALYFSNLTVLSIVSFYFRSYYPWPLVFALRVISGVVAHHSFALFLFHMFRRLTKIKAPLTFVAASFITVCFVLSNFFLRFPPLYFWAGVGFIMLFVTPFLQIFVSMLSKGRPSRRFLTINVFLGLSGFVLLVMGLAWLIGPREKTAFQVGSDGLLAKGPFQTVHFTYGSGNDKNREEFGKSARYVTPSVDGRRLLPEWTEKKQKQRQRYWGFGTDRFPLNGRVWMPEGDGPFPLVLIVHGNHSMLEYSDPGYAYLGEWLASKGYVLVSVDENFLNAAPDDDFRGKEMPARAWLLLKHLEVWRDWNESPEHELFGKIDMDRIALAGHSRGGEAVSMAAVFNHLAAFPDNALEPFNFGFGIKGVITLAQTDYRYLRRMELEGVSFLTLQGSLDSDEDSFYGLRQFRRTQVSDSTFKAGLFIHGANHGQFNSVWGSNDAGPPYSYLLNKTILITGEQQMATAKLAIGAFLEVIFESKEASKLAFREKNVISAAVPGVEFGLAFQDGQSAILEDFENDIDVSTFGKGSAKGENLQVWMEEFMQYKGERLHENQALQLGWAGKTDSLKPVYQVVLPQGIELAGTPTHFTFDLSHGNKEKLDSVEGELLPPDFDVVFVDAKGNQEQFKLSDYHKLSPRAESRYLKSDKLTKKYYNALWEPHFEYVEMDLTGTVFNWKELREMRLEFSSDRPGIIYLDNFGFRSEN